VDGTLDKISFKIDKKGLDAPSGRRRKAEKGILGKKKNVYLSFRGQTGRLRQKTKGKSKPGEGLADPRHR